MYRAQDVEAIRNIIPNLKDEIQTKKLELFEPTLSERNIVNKNIYDFIIKKKRIVYGGFAQNKLIGEKNKDDEFYTKLDTPDIEFYTPTPIEDLIEITQILFKNGHKRISGQEGVHSETYKIFVNFEDYCDISYMPKHIFNNMPYVIHNNMRFATPLFMLIDSYRVYSDPITSWWRIEKSFNRTELLLKHYPLPKNQKNLKITFSKKNTTDHRRILRLIRKQVFHKFDTIIVFGYYAYNYYMKKAQMKQNMIDIPHYDVISTNYEKDIIEINKILKKSLKNIRTKEFYPFFQFTGRSIQFYNNNDLILNIYEHNNRCTVYRELKSKKKTKIVTFQLELMMSLIEIAYNQVNKKRYEEKNQKILFANLIEARNKYLERKKITVMDKSPFIEFSIECIGNTMEQTRIQRLLIEERKKKNKPYVFRYQPSEKEKKIPDYRFSNSSGNEITNSKYKIIKNN
jgi:hypothetical protein